MAQPSPLRRTQQLFYDVLEPKGRRRRLGGIVDAVLVILIAVNILFFVLETVEPLAAAYAPLFDAVFTVSIIVFTVEYLLRLWVCTLDGSGLRSHPVRGRLRYMLTPLALTDLLAILPYYVALLSGADLRFLRLIRLLWILKITRYLPAMRMLGHVLIRERRTLAAVLAVMLIMLFVASSLVYLFEHERQPERFASIPHAMWWGVATLTTVGFGDVVPVTPMGKLVGVVIMLLGVGTFALPAGILASAFAQERKRRDFMVTWNLVAQVPFFASLDAKEIADIAALLHPREALANEVIFHEEDEAESMFFIVRGELRAETRPEPILMKGGEYFGEIALVYRRARTATVLALQRSELLELDAKDLHSLLERKPAIRAQILREAERRLRRSAAPDAAAGEGPDDAKTV